jgi:hypothetical protein
MFSGEDLAIFGLELITALAVGELPEPYWSFRSKDVVRLDEAHDKLATYPRSTKCPAYSQGEE